MALSKREKRGPDRTTWPSVNSCQNLRCLTARLKRKEERTLSAADQKQDSFAFFGISHRLSVLAEIAHGLAVDLQNNVSSAKSCLIGRTSRFNRSNHHPFSPLQPQTLSHFSRDPLDR